MTENIKGRTPDETKKGLQCLINLSNGTCDFPHCNKCPLYIIGYKSTETVSDAATYIQRLESELEPIRKAKEEDRLIILPYAPGTPVYIVDDYEIIPVK